MLKHVPIRFAFSCAAVILSLALAPVAFAGKPSGGGGKSPDGGTIALVLLDSTDGLPHWGQRVRFDVQTTATTQPRVDLQCHQGGAEVYFAQTGYYDGYLWPWTQTFTLRSGAWTGGDADCTAVLYKLANNGRRTDLARLSFRVLA